MNTRDGFILFVLLNALDAATTVVILNGGGTELAPIYNLLHATTPKAIVLWKIFGVVVVLVLVLVFRKFAWPWVLKWVNIGLGVTCLFGLVGMAATIISKGGK